jgi:hypothetical protein
LEGFLVNDLGVKNLEEFKTNSRVVNRLVEFFNINKDFIYGNSDKLLIEKSGFYKRNEEFCEEFLNSEYSKLYIISERTPDKEYDKKNDDNYFYLIAEKEKELFNGKKINIFEVFNTNGCRWGYWRCRWEIKKFLLCLKRNFSINMVTGIVNETISKDYFKFIRGEIKFEKILGNLTIWYPEDYIEFKYQNLNAKEEDELKEILKEIENVKGNKKEFELIYKFKHYLIEMYGYEEKDIKIEYKIDGFRADLVILKNEKPFIVFELKLEFNGFSNYKKQIFSAYLGKIDYFALVIPYENEWYMECYNSSGKLIENIPFNKKVSEKLISKKLYDFFYRGGKEDIQTVEDKIFYTLLNYSFLKEDYKNNQITPIAILNKIKSFSLNEQEIFIVLRLLSFIKVKNNKKLIESVFDLLVDKKSGFLQFKIELVEFLNNLAKGKNYYIIGFQPDMIKLNFNKCFIKDKNKYADLVKKLLDCNKNENIFNILLS